MLEDSQGFIANNRVDGALFKADIKKLPENTFSSRGINHAVEHLGIVFSDINYVNPRMDAPCMYGFCDILKQNVAIESHLSWKMLKEMRRREGGVFVISIVVENELSFSSRLLVKWDIEPCALESIKMSPILGLLEKQT